MHIYSEKSSKLALHKFIVQKSKWIEAYNSANKQLLLLLRKHKNTQLGSPSLVFKICTSGTQMQVWSSLLEFGTVTLKNITPSTSLIYLFNINYNRLILSGSATEKETNNYTSWWNTPVPNSLWLDLHVRSCDPPSLLFLLTNYDLSFNNSYQIRCFIRSRLSRKIKYFTRKFTMFLQLTPPWENV